MNTTTQKHKLHRYAENGEQEDERFWNDTREHLEKFVTTKVYKRIFGVDPRDADRDEILERKSAEFDGTPQDLHIESKDVEKWNRAAELLRRVDSYRAPRDKLIVIVNCVRMMNEILAGTCRSHHSQRHTSTLITTTYTGTSGADRLVPAMIYVTIKANPTRFASNLKYVRQYRDEKMMRGEEKYALVVAESAVRFLLEETEEEEEEDEDEDEENLFFSEEDDSFVCTFRDVQSAGDLRLDDIPKLLHEYKRLCKLVEKRLLVTKKSAENNNGDGDDLLVGLLD